MATADTISHTAHTASPNADPSDRRGGALHLVLAGAGALLVLGVLIWQGITAHFGDLDQPFRSKLTTCFGGS